MEQKLFNLVGTVLALSHFQFTDPSKGTHGESSALILTGTTFILSFCFDVWLRVRKQRWVPECPLAGKSGGLFISKMW